MRVTYSHMGPHKPPKHPLYPTTQETSETPAWFCIPGALKCPQPIKAKMPTH